MKFGLKNGAVALLLMAVSTLSQALVFAVNEGVTYRVPNEEIRAKYAAIAADLSKLLRQPVTVEPVGGYPALPRVRQPVHQSDVLHNPLVLMKSPVNCPTPTADRDQPVSRRFKPSSRTALNGEQPYPWNLLQLQDAMSRHRGAKPPRR